MKKIVFFLLCAFCLSACNNDDDSEIKKTDYAGLIVGEWVYDHPEEGVWEAMKFTSSGMLYFSNSNDNLFEFDNEEINGRYFLDGANVTGTYKLQGITLNLDMVITKMNECEFTAKFNDTGLSFTYARQIDSQMVDYQETVMPNYSNLVRNAKIIGYSSHNANVASVNASTGEITGVSAGITYIDVVTSEGTAVVAVKVRGMLPYNYDEFIGTERSKIYEIFGTTPAVDETTVIMYQNISTEIEYLYVGFDAWTGKVSSIALSLNDVTPSYAIKMAEYLSKLYTVYEKPTTSTYKAYINNKNFADATVGVTWDIPNTQITYIAISHDLFTDYSPLIGKTSSEVESMMGDNVPFQSTKEYLAYGISDGIVDMVSFYFTLDFATIHDDVQAVILALNSSVNSSEIIGYLSKKYVYMEKESTATDKVYLTSDGLMAILYSIDYGQVMYMSNVAGTQTKSIRFMSNLKKNVKQMNQ